MMIFMILWWVLVIVAIVFLVKWMVDKKSGVKNEDSALDIIEKRYAGGEISKEEYDEQKKHLEQS